MVLPKAKDPVLDFMVLRSPDAVSHEGLHRSWVRDDFLTVDRRGAPPLVQRSKIAEIVYRHVFCTEGSDVESIIDELLSLLWQTFPGCPIDGGDGTRTWGDDSPPLHLEAIERYPHVVIDGVYFLIPSLLENLDDDSLIPELLACRRVLDAVHTPYQRDSVLTDLGRIFDRPLVDVIFNSEGHTEEYKTLKRLLFDLLYLLYILRRKVAVDLGPTIDGIATLHALEALAVDQVCGDVSAGTASGEAERLMVTLAEIVPSLRQWDGKSAPGIPLIRKPRVLRSWLDATPIVHPLMARLFGYRHPFNDIKPIGVGDLKVVKQWLTGYEVGEIAYIENVLDSEQRSRTHRRLEKSEETLSFTSEQQTETSRDTQTTDRFEMKREAEQILKTDVNANAGLSVNVDYQGAGYKVVSTVTGGFAYARSATESQKLATSFAQDVVDRAVTRVQNRTSRSRTTVTTFESEETNRHGFDNRNGDGHISGVYRWLDKVYTAQVYNYGKRLMFEFVLPEPGAFLIQSRLAAFAGTVDVPQPPSRPKSKEIDEWLKNFDPGAISEDKYYELAKKYDLSALPYPVMRREIDFVDSGSGRDYFTEHDIDSGVLQARTYTCRVDAKGYHVTKLTFNGRLHFWGKNEHDGNEQNTFRLYVDGHQCFEGIDNNYEYWVYGPGSNTVDVSDTPALSSDVVNVGLEFWDIANFELSLHAELELGGKALREYQQKVYDKMRSVEQAKVDTANIDADQSWQADMSTYRNRLGELQAAAVNDLIQGQSEAFNRRLILRELKRQCLAMLTKEMDADDSDDVWTDYDDTGTRNIDFEMQRFKITEGVDDTGQPEATASFIQDHVQTAMVVPKLKEAREKGRIVQFLEQAFEWQLISYLPYSYFWAPTPRWVELMSHSDNTDPFLTDFLQAGSVRVLVAVSPAYNNSALHFLATGQPWDGGPSPAIGDPLFIPLYAEVRDTQDDLAGATPVGKSWTFNLPTSLIYLENSSTPLPAPEA